MSGQLKPKPTRNRLLIRIAHARGASHEPLLRRRAARFLRDLDLQGVELSLSLVSDREIRQVNREWRGKDRPTDVLSFPAGEMPLGAPIRKPLGDVVISLDTAVRVARQRKLPLASELSLYLAHGLLHLLGHDHHRPAERRRMAEWEGRLLRSEGMILRSEDPLG